MHRLYYALLLSVVVSCVNKYSNTRDVRNEPCDVFYSQKLQDSLSLFVCSIDSIPNTCYAPEYMLEFQTDGADTLMLMFAAINITPSWELNGLPKEIYVQQRHHYPLGAAYVCERPVLVRIVDDIDISDIVDISILDNRMGNSIDSHTRDGYIPEPYWASAHKLFKFNYPDSLTLLSKRYFGKYYLNTKPDYGIMF